jgi:replicative DNA helicase
LIKVFQLSQSLNARQVASFSEMIVRSYLQTKANVESGVTLSGVPSDYKTIDLITHGWHPSDLIILAARPGMGKSSLMINLFLNSGKLNIPAAIFSLEMSSEQLLTRIQSNECEIEHDKLRNNQLASYELNLLGKKTDRLRELPLFIDDTPAMTLGEIRSKARAYVSRHKVSLIFIDYLQMIRSETNNPNREQVIGEISRGLKALAKELNVPIIAISSLSRACESRTDKRPILSDLRESGSIESDADLVIFLYRDEMYKITQDAQGNSTSGVAEIIIAKHRNGNVDTAFLKFSGKYQKFFE